MKYTSLAQLDTWAYAGCPELPLNVFYWKGMDGSTILCQAKNNLLVDGGPHDLPYYSTPEGKPRWQNWRDSASRAFNTGRSSDGKPREKPRYLTYPAQLPNCPPRTMSNM